MNAAEFLVKHRMNASYIDPSELSKRMAAYMEEHLASYSDTIPMIPTFLSNEGTVRKDENVIVIDAGGTNYRVALVAFDDNGIDVRSLNKHPMPGIGKPCSWDEFISFVADSLMPIIDKADRIGFCFSYPAQVTPEIDGKVIGFTKEVEITESTGKLVGKSVIEELEKRGVKGKKILILNDTPAVLLGGSTAIDKSLYGGFIGQVSGTGTNTCCILPMNRISKLHSQSDKSILVNMESGSYCDMPCGEFDEILDANSHNPGHSRFEKMSAGVYLGDLCRMMADCAAREGYISQHTADNIHTIEHMDTSVVDAWASGERLDVCDNDSDKEFLSSMSLNMIERSARAMCSCITGTMLLTGEGKDKNRPVCVFAEGSFVQKSRHYLRFLQSALNKYAGEENGQYAIVRVGDETTLSGSAAAALLNL